MKKLLLFFVSIFILCTSNFKVNAQPILAAGRIIVPGSYYSLTDSNGNFNPYISSPATWISSNGWRLINNEDAVRTISFNIENLRNSNLKWHAKVVSAQSTYVTFIQWYGNTSFTPSPNTFITTPGVEMVVSGDLNSNMDFTDFSLDFSKSWLPLSAWEPDMLPVYITEFWIEMDQVVLPITLSKFEAQIKGDDILINWSTASEQSNKGFIIERSNDGKNWSSIGFIGSEAEYGNSTQELNYKFTDNDPKIGNNIYRLAQVDWEGKVTYSSIIFSNFVSHTQINVYPNPTDGIINIVGIVSGTPISIYDMIGKVVLQLTYNGKEIDLSTLKTSNYIVDINKVNQFIIYKK